MGAYNGLFDTLGLREWCDEEKIKSVANMADLLAQVRGGADVAKSWWDISFPSLNVLNESCKAIPRTRDVTGGVEQGFLIIKDDLKFILDPITQPLSWLLEGSLYTFTNMPWWVLIPLILAAVFYTSRSWSIVSFVGTCFIFFAFIDHFTYAIQTLSIIFVCTGLCVMIGVPIGVGMSKSNRFRRFITPVLDMLQTLPSFVYLIPLIFLFSATEPKLYGIAIIMYAIVPVIRLTDLGVRLVEKDVIEAADAFGMTARQKLFGVEIPLALPNIMAGINQTIMMALAMVVIASLVSAPGLGVLVLRGIRSLDLGVGLISGLCIVLLAVILDRVSKATLARMNVAKDY
ncbi:MAG: ABC transporter permease subunit [Hyphomicrobiaceae bacterium]|nr:ABC transporter permease subunit [Hyphomicrobiaceae bacterium]